MCIRVGVCLIECVRHGMINRALLSSTPFIFNRQISLIFLALYI
jgi:hypothetical protein